MLYLYTIIIQRYTKLRNHEKRKIKNPTGSQKTQDENYAKEFNKEVEFQFDYSLIEDEEN